jgi:hypothetical protein
MDSNKYPEDDFDFDDESSFDELDLDEDEL